MVDTMIKLLDESSLEELFKFEIENRSYFDKIGLPRADRYYDFNNFKITINNLLREQEKGLIYMYLVMDYYGKVIGRVNIVSIVRENLNKAELGYRIGEKYQNKGHGTNGVKLVLDQATNIHKLHRIEAGIWVKNIGSKKVLLKNGFQFVGAYKEYFFQNNKWNDSMIFEKIID